MTAPNLFHEMLNRGFGADVCFFCAIDLNDENRTREHVIPQWVIRQLGLRDQRLTLMNGTTLKYTQLLVPCCVDCNGAHLSRIESKIRGAIAGGFESLLALDRVVVYLWLSKILYGIVYRENLLRADQRVPGSGPIIPQESLESLATHHFFLQAARHPIRFDGFLPASIFFFKLRDDQGVSFDFRDSPISLTIAVRLGSVGIVAALQDGGAQEYVWGAGYKRLRDTPLSHEQFVEIYCRVHYAGTTFNRTPKYMIFDQNGETAVMQMPLQGLTSRRLFDPMDIETYARVLAFHSGLSFDDVFVPPDDTISWLAPLEQSRDDDGRHTEE